MLIVPLKQISCVILRKFIKTSVCTGLSPNSFDCLINYPNNMFLVSSHRAVCRFPIGCAIFGIQINICAHRNQTCDLNSFFLLRQQLVFFHILFSAFSFSISNIKAMSNNFSAAFIGHYKCPMCGTASTVMSIFLQLSKPCKHYSTQTG